MKNRIIILILIMIFPAGNGLQGEPGKKNILILNSYHQGYPWSDRIMKGMESVLATELKDAEIYYKHMDMKRIPGIVQLSGLYTVYRHMDYSIKFDLVLASDNDAIDFLVKYRESLFRNTPVVFCGLNDYHPAIFRGVKYITGVIENIDYKSTLELIKTIDPSVEEVAIISDNTTTGIAHYEAVMHIIKDITGKIKFRSLSMSDYTFDNFLIEVGKLQGKKAILLLSHFKDALGKTYSQKESIDLIVKNAAVPIYVVTDSRMGEGVLGGKVVSGFHQGKTAAEIGLRILRGENINSIPVSMDSPNTYMFDYNQLKRWGIDESRLPAGSIIINKPDSFYAKYSHIVWQALIIFTILILIIILLFIGIVKKRFLEKELRESSRRYFTLAEISPVGIFYTDINGICLYENRRHVEIAGETAGKNLGESWAEFLHPEEKERILAGLGRLFEQNIPFKSEFRFINSGGSSTWVMGQALPEIDEMGWVNRFMGVITDITERKKSEIKLRDTLEIKDSLLKEIHHRVKNNLNIILSLINLQTYDIQDRKALDILKVLTEKIRSIALVHEKIYKSDDFSTINLNEYIHDLSSLVLTSFSDGASIIRLSIDVNNDLRYDINSLVPLGLIITEMLTNSLKYAFPGGREGEIRISMQEERGFILLNFSDNGVGIPGEISLYEADTLGLKLLSTLAQQLGGILELHREKGTSYIIRMIKKV